MYIEKEKFRSQEYIFQLMNQKEQQGPAAGLCWWVLIRLCPVAEL